MATTTQSPVNSGASNAADFQPGTQNPQTPSTAQLFSQSSGPQTGGQEQLLQNKNVRISVPVNPAPATQSAAQVRSGNGEVIVALVLAALVAAWLVWRKRRRQAPKVSVVVPKAPEPVAKKAAPVTAPTPPKPKKPAPKKSKSQRKKRARR